MSTVTVTTAIPLSSALRAQVEKTLQARLGKTEFTLIEKVDPSVIGGIRLDIDGVAYDSTVAGKLSRLA